MPTLREFFTTEAGELLEEIGKTVQRLDRGAGTPADLQRHSKGLRGSAQMAREDRVFRAAVGLEAAARSVAAGAIGWSEEVSSRVRRSLEDIEALVRGGEGDDDADGRVRRSLDSWKEVGVDIPEEGAANRGAGQVSEASRQFRQFAAHEISGIVAEMEVSLETLAADPRNRDPLKSIMRRQRAMMGAARLDELPVVAEALRATEDLTRVIAKLNVPVKEEWLSVFRSSRDVLKSALDPLQKGETPAASPALSKLRVLRQELLERFGQGEAVPATGGPPQQQAVYTAPPQTAPPAPVAPAPAAAAQAPPAPALAAMFAMAADDDDDAVNIEDLAYDPGTEPVPIEELQYSGARALQRALELRPQLERLIAADPSGRESVEEMFDLIQLAIA